MRLVILFIILISHRLLANSDVPTLKVIQLDDNVYQHISYKKVEPYGVVAASGLMVVEGNEAHIIDTPWTVADTEKLLKWAKLKGLMVKSAVVTHFHEDASGGMSLLNKLKIKTYATPLTNQWLKVNNREQSSNELSTEPVKLANGLIEVFYPGPGHTQDNIVIWLAKTETLFGGCFVKSLSSKTLGNIDDASIEDWPQSIKKVQDKYPDIKTIVPGHGKVGGRRLLNHTQQLALSVKTQSHTPHE